MTNFKPSDFNYHLPEELIAHRPAKVRSDSRLLVVDRSTGSISHEKFSNITRYLKEQDILVMNDTKVIPARLFGHKYGTGAKIEILLNKMIGESIWEVMAKPSKRLGIGNIIEFAPGFYAEIKEKHGDGRFILYFASIAGIEKDIEKYGHTPLPPYIDPKKSGLSATEIRDRYQTVYADKQGATAAPTAGLHFTKELLNKIKAGKVFVTLHTGLGTFAPVREEDIRKHKMHSENYHISGDVFKKIVQAKAEGHRIVAVGTTSARLLESITGPGEGHTDMFIYPGYSFRKVNALITNFHLPKSTLLMLVSAFAQMATADRSAFAGRDLIMKAYNEAVKEKYRFFSFGDAMLIK